MKLKLILILISILLVGCASKEVRPIIVDYSCHFLRPILLSEKDSLTEATRQQIINYNEMIDKTCPDF